MSARRQWLILGVVAVVLGGAVWGGIVLLGDQFEQVTVGSPAPDFAAVTVDSVPQPRTLADYKGQVTVINIWATWCFPCIAEMPLIEQLYTEFRSQGLRVAAVSIDSPGMDQAIAEFIAEHKLTFDVLYDADGRIMLNYMTSGVPSTFILGKDGVIRHMQMAPVKENNVEQLRSLLRQLLAE